MEEIKSAFKKLALDQHPDKQINDALVQRRAQEYFAAVREAFEVLKDPLSRSRYDMELLIKERYSTAAPFDTNLFRKAPPTWKQTRARTPPHHPRPENLFNEWKVRTLAERFPLQPNDAKDDELLHSIRHKLDSWDSFQERE